VNNDSILKGGLIVSMRPQVAVELTETGDVVISTAFISDDFNRVEHADVRFPADCAGEIARAILEVTGGHPA
jgi:hypothetical protein